MKWLLYLFGVDTKEKCRCGGEWKYYNIGFDDGYQCQSCSRIIETYQYIKLPCSQ